MSEWYEAKEIDLDSDQREINILVNSNDSGNVYVTLTWDQVFKINKRIRDELNEPKVLHDELTKAFINYQYRLENPMPTSDETQETMINKYRTDSIFHAKVDSLACGVMWIVEKHKA